MKKFCVLNLGTALFFLYLNDPRFNHCLTLFSLCLLVASNLFSSIVLIFKIIASHINGTN